MQKKLNKKNAVFNHSNIKNVLSIFVVASLILTSTLSVATINNLNNVGSGNSGDLKYNDISYSYNDYSSDDVSGVSNLDNVDAFSLLPPDGQDKILSGKSNLEVLRDGTNKRIQNLKDRLFERLAKRSFDFSLLSKLFGVETSYVEDGVDDVIESSSISGIEDEQMPMCCSTSEQDSDSVLFGALSDEDDIDSGKGNITVIPESGHIMFMGYGSMQFDMILDVNGTIATIIGSLDMGPDTTSVDLIWNLSQGYFEITGNGYFEFSNLYLNINDSIIFVTDSLVVDAFGHIMIDHRGYEGNFSLDGVVALEGLTFDVNLDLMGGNVSVGASFDFSKMGEADSLSFSWGEDGIVADGNFVGESELNIYDFSVEFTSSSTNIAVSADHICLHNSVVLEFIEDEDEGVVMCHITSHDLTIQGLYLAFGETNLFVDSITVDVDVELILQTIDANQYITEEEGHISIGGCFALSIDTTLNVEGTIVDISGVLKLDYGYLNIEWDKTEGFFKISATKIVEIDDFSISVDGEWISLGWDEFIIFTDGYLMVEELDDLNNSAHLVMDKCSEITGIYFNGAIGENDASLSIGSIVFVDGSLFEVTLYNNTVILDLDASLGYGLILHDLNIEAMGFEVDIAAIIVMGSWHVFYSDEILEIETDGFIEILGLKLNQNAGGISSTMLTSSCITASGETEIKVIGGKVIFAAYDMDAFLNIGLPGLGAANVELYGDARLVIDLINGTVYASIDGYGNVGFAGMGLTASVSFEGHADISLVGDALTVSASFTAGISVTMGLSMALLNNFNIGMMIGVSGYVSGSATAYLNLTTGEFHYEGNVIVVVLVHVSDISGYGENVWLNNDDFYLRIDKILVDLMDSDIYAWVCIHVSISDMGMGMSMSDIILWGDVQGTAAIDGIYLRTKSSFPIPFELYIEHIEFDADFIIHPSSISLTNMLGGSNVYVEGSLGLTIEGFELYIEGATINIGKIDLQSGNLDIQLQGSEIRIDGTGTYISLNDFDLDGVITLEDGSKIIPSGTIDLIQFASESSSFTFYYNSEGTENGEELIIVVDGGDGLINIEGVENLGATLYDADGNPSISGSVDIDSIDLTLEGYVKVYTDGTIEANCAGTFSVENLDLDFDSWSDSNYNGIVDDGETSHIDLTITNLIIEFSGHIIIYPKDEDEDKPPVIDVEGQVDIDLDGSINRGDDPPIDFEVDGSIYVDGAITVDWEKDNNGIWMVNIIFDSTAAEDYGVFIDYFSLNTIQKDDEGVSFPIEVTIDNYWGTGMFEFSIDLHENILFMENQMFAVWEEFSFSLLDGFIIGEIYHFYGDIEISDIGINVDSMLMRYGVDSNNGYENYFGFNFYSDPADNDPETYDGFEFYGDIDVTLFGFHLHVTSIRCDPDTRGTFKIEQYDNEPETLYITFETTSGNAEIATYLTGADNRMRVWIILDSDAGINQMPIPVAVISNWITIGSAFLALMNGNGDQVDWSNVLASVLDLIMLFEQGENLQEINDILNALIFDLDGQSLEQLLEDYGDHIPDWLREKLEELLRELPQHDDSCFLEGTKIEMSDGSLKNIEEIVVGDQVASYDVTNDIWTNGVVTEVFHHAPDEMTEYYLILNNDLRVTPNHPVMVDGVWIDAGELEIGDNFGGNLITSINYVYKRVPTYNFEVDVYHTYNVVWGESAKSVVHNPVDSMGPAQSETVTKKSIVQKAVSSDKNPCFLEDTKIGMANGSTKYIQDIELGDQVLSYDIENETWTNGTVVEVDHHTADEMPSYYMVINNDLRVTPNHPVYVKSGTNYQPNPAGPGLTALNEGNGKWIAAGDLQVGQELDGQVITSIRQVYHRVPTYNFKVEPYHNYRVVWGETNSIAHENESLLEAESEEPDAGAPGHPDVSNPPVNPPNVTNPWGDKDQSCFVAGTQVEMSDGLLKNIEDVQVGDSVKSYDEESGEQKMGFVSKVFHHISSEMTDYYMIINSALGITPNHPVFINNEWIDAGDIRIGDNFGGNIVSSIKYVYERVPTYNIEVEPYHTYNVVWGENANSVVHNFEAESDEIQTSTIQRLLTSDKKKPTCFLEDTKIQMNDGSSKDIQDIKIGDVVRAFDTESDEWKTAEVIELFHHSAEEMVDYYLIINDDLRITPNHPVYVDNKWIDAGDLKVGDVFGGELIISIKKVFEKVPTYNFDVEPYHTYNVIWGSSDDSIVHNDDVLGGSDSSAGSSTIYTKKTVISGTKYGTVDVADSGLKATIKVPDIMEFEPFQMVSKTYKDIAGQKVVVNEDKYVLTEDGVLVEINDNQGWSVETDDDSSVRNYGVQKNEETVQDGLETIDEVKTYIRENVVNRNSHSSSDDDDGSCCFPAGTLITMADGAKKPIEKIYIGEYVLSYDTQLGVFVSNVVKEMVSPIRKGVYNINSGLIYPTDDHPFYTMKTDGTIGWASIDPVKSELGYLMTPMMLEVGDKVFTVSHGWVVVDSIEYIEGPVQTFNLEDVSGVSNFFANDVLVHNAVDCAHSTTQINGTMDPVTFSVLNFYGDGVDTPVDMGNGIPVQFTTGGNFITFGNIGVSGMTEIFVVNKMDIYPPGAFDWEDDDGLDAIPLPDLCCFPAGTLITMADGTKKLIESVAVGDYVLSYDTSNGVFLKSIVKETVSPVRDGVYSINNGLLMPTDDHPLYVMKADGTVGWASIDPEKSEFGYLMTPMMLEVGDKVFTVSQGWVVVDSIEYIEGPVQTFNLEDVSGVSNFFANDVLVHNAVDCFPKIPTETETVDGGSTQLSLTSKTYNSYSDRTGGLQTLVIPIARTMDNIYYPAESITPGDIIKAYNAETHQLVNALVTDVSMSLTEGKYVDIELMQYSAFQNYEQQINDLESYLEKSGSEGSTITPLKLDPCKKIFLGMDQSVKTIDGFVNAVDLDIGDRLIGYNDAGFMESLVVSCVQVKRNVIPVYNITLNYFPTIYRDIEGVDAYDDSVHCYIADGVIVGDYLAARGIHEYQGFPAETKIMIETSSKIKGEEESSDSQLNNLYKNIEDVNIGDIVISYDTENNTIVNASVLEKFEYLSQGYLLISLRTSKEDNEDKSDNNNLLFSLFRTPNIPSIPDIPDDTNGDESDGGEIVFKIAANHLVYTYSDESSSFLYSAEIDSEKNAKSSLNPKRAGNLQIGDLLYMSNGETAMVSSINSVHEEGKTYTIIVDKYHNYFADDMLVFDDKNNYNYDERQEKNELDNPGVSLESTIKITAVQDTSKPGYINDALCFGYYTPQEYTYEYGYFKENRVVEKSTANIDSVISNIIRKLVERFPLLAKISFFQRYLEIDEDNIDEPSDAQDDSLDEQEDADDVDTTPQEDDDTQEIPDDEVPVEDYEEDVPEETEPNEEQDDELEDNPVVSPFISKPEMTSLQRDLLDIIEENSEDPDELIHYIWDFGDGSYAYGKEPVHSYDLGYTSGSTTFETNSFSGVYSSSQPINEIVTYLVTLLIVDCYGNIVDMDMTSVTFDLTWSAGSSGYVLTSYSLYF